MPISPKYRPRPNLSGHTFPCPVAVASVKHAPVSPRECPAPLRSVIDVSTHPRSGRGNKAQGRSKPVDRQSTSRSVRMPIAHCRRAVRNPQGSRHISVPSLRSYAHTLSPPAPPNRPISPSHLTNDNAARCWNSRSAGPTMKQSKPCTALLPSCHSLSLSLSPEARQGSRAAGPRPPQPSPGYSRAPPAQSATRSPSVQSGEPRTS